MGDRADESTEPRPPEPPAPSRVYREAAERSASTALVVMDLDGVVRSWDRGATAMFGYEPAQAVGRTVAELIVPEALRDPHNAGVARVRARGTSPRFGGTFTFPAMTAGGGAVTVRVTLAPVEVGGAVMVLAVLSLATDAATSDHAVPARDVLQVIFERAPEAITVLDAWGRQLTVNRAGADLLGYGAGGRHPGDGRPFLHPDDRSRPLLTDEGRDGPVRYRALAADGTYRWLETVVADLRDVEEVGGFVAFSRDVTADEATRRALRASEAQLAAALAAMPAAAVVEDGGRHVAHANQRFRDLLAIDDAFPPGVEVRPLLRSLAHHIVRPAAAAATLTRAHLDDEVFGFSMVEWDDGRTFELESVPVDNESGAIGRLWLLRDVTARTRAEARLRDALDRAEVERLNAEERSEQLRSIDEARLAFVAAVSHELRTPLASVVSATEHLTSGAMSSVELTTFLDVIGRNAGRLSRLVEDLLTVGRLDAGMVELLPGPVDVPALVADVVDGFRAQAAAADVELGLESGPGPVLIGDEFRLRQVVENLLTNAVKFAGSGARVQVRCGATAEAWVLDVADDGPGIPAEEAAEVFRPFFRSRAGSRSQVPGTGLGLAIVRGLVALHGGTAVLVPTDIGTCVRCTLPFQKGRNP